MWLMEQSSFKKDIKDGEYKATQLDLTAWSENKTYTPDNSPLKQFNTKSIKANAVSKNRSLNRKLRTEKQIVDLVAREFTRNPHLIKHLPNNPYGDNITDALNRIQSSIYASTGKQVNLIKAYTVSERTLGLLHQLLAMTAKGIIVPTSKLYNTKGFSAARGSSTQRIYLISTKQSTSNQFRKIGKMSGLYNSKPAITHFRIEAINELKAYLPDPKKHFTHNEPEINIVADDTENLFDELAFNYGTETWGRNDTNTNTTMANTNRESDYALTEEEAFVSSLANMTDKVLAQNVWDGFITKDELRAALKRQPARLVKVSKELQKLSTL